jgi:hypothetical protein
MEKKQFEQLMATQFLSESAAGKGIADQLFNHESKDYCRGFFYGVEYIAAKFPELVSHPDNAKLSQVMSFLLRAAASKFTDI